VADKALSYSNYIQWDSDATKIIKLPGYAAAMVSSDRETHAARLVSEVANFHGYHGSRPYILQSIEAAFRKVHAELQYAEILFPQMLTLEQYHSVLMASEINEHMRDVAEKVQRFALECELLVCGFDYDLEPYLFHVTSPGIVTDFTSVGFHAIGSGAEKAVAQLLFDEHKRSNPASRTLYDCFDAKAHAEMAVGVGYEWDACLIFPGAIEFVEEEGKKLIDQVWSKYNRSPFDTRKPDDLPNPPRNWKDRLHHIVATTIMRSNAQSVPEFARDHASAATSSMDQSRSDTPAAIAGVTRSVL
jgi:hypothetical protein